MAVLEKGKVAGAHQLSGAVMNPSAIRELFPDDDSWPHYGEVERRARVLHAQQEARDPAGPDPAAVPQPRQLRHLGRRAQPLAGREGRGGGRVHPHRDRRREAAGRGRQRASASARGDKGRDKEGGREGQLRARLRRHRQGDRARRGLLGPPHRRRAEGPRPRGEGPAGVGARRQGGVGGRAAARQGHPHARLAAAPAGQVQGVRRLVDLPHEPRGRDAARLDRLRRRPRLGRRAAVPARPAPGVQAAPAGAQDPRGRQARGLGREGDPRGRLLGDAHAARARDADRRRLRRHGQRAEAQGRPLRDQVRDAGGGDDLPRS